MLRGVAVIYREEAQRFIPVSFRLHGENTAKALAKIQKALAPLFEKPYWVECDEGW